MLRQIERSFKRLVALTLRLVLGSRKTGLPPNPSFNRILVIRQHNQLGDMLCVVPLLRGLRKRFPDAHIAIMASPVNAGVMYNSPYLNEVILYDKRTFLGKGFEGWRALLRFIKELRSKEFELVLVPSTVSTSFTSDFFAYLSGAQYRIGAESLNGKQNPSAMFFNITEELDWSSTPDRHQTQRNLDVARSLQIEEGDLQLIIGFNEHEQNYINLLKNNKKQASKLVIAYHPGAGKIPNRWEAGRFGRVANELNEKFHCATVITCGPMDDRPVYDMIGWMKVSYNLIKGKGIREVACVLASVDLVITNDTGVMHVAGSVGTPVLSLFGPTEPEQWAPPGNHNRYIRGRRNDINNISVEEVVQNASEMLSSRTV